VACRRAGLLGAPAYFSSYDLIKRNFTAQNDGKPMSSYQTMFAGADMRHTVKGGGCHPAATRPPPGRHPAATRWFPPWGS
jgi:hypothetical protein